MVGGDLWDGLAAEGRFTESRGRLCIVEIALALGFLHSKALVYGGLAPDCVLFDVDRHVRMIDFGVVRGQMDIYPCAVSIARMIGYLAPRSSPGRPMPNCLDWWSLGITGV
jgi:serine/threonine protein kinase